MVCWNLLLCIFEMNFLKRKFQWLRMKKFYGWGRILKTFARLACFIRKYWAYCVFILRASKEEDWSRKQNRFRHQKRSRVHMNTAAAVGGVVRGCGKSDGKGCITVMLSIHSIWLLSYLIENCIAEIVKKLIQWKQMMWHRRDHLQELSLKSNIVCWFLKSRLDIMILLRQSLSKGRWSSVFTICYWKNLQQQVW